MFIIFVKKTHLMFKTKTLAEYTPEELNAEKTKRKAIFYSYCVIFSLMVITGIFITMKKGMNFFTFMPLFFLFTFFIMWKNYNDVKKEILSRNSVSTEPGQQKEISLP